METCSDDRGAKVAATCRLDVAVLVDALACWADTVRTERCRLDDREQNRGGGEDSELGSSGQINLNRIVREAVDAGYTLSDRRPRDDNAQQCPR